jgi:hypothetical protein
MPLRGLTSVPFFAAVVTVLVFCGAGQAKASCDSVLLQDWTDGRIDGTYSVGCYRAALAHLPEDLRIYSSAESDIKRALLARSEVVLATKAQRPTAKAQNPTVKAQSGGESGGRHGVSPLLVLGISAALIAVMGSTLALRR